MTYLLLVVGLVILSVGAELLVRGAVTLAFMLRISPLVVGLTIVAFGTSAPELAVSALSSLKGETAIALGNVVGSNVLNVLLILGASAVIIPLSVSSQLVRSDVPLMIAASLAVWIAAYNGLLGFWEGVAMLVTVVVYSLWLVLAGRKESRQGDLESMPQAPASCKALVGNILLLLIGLAMLVGGAQLLVDSATTIARQLGISELVIGLTIISIGTSLPELATSIAAAMKGQRDLAVGNIVGSNMYNLLLVLASAMVLAPAGVEVAAPVLWFDLTIMVWVALLCWPIFFSHATISRGEGVVLLLLYVTYTGLLFAESMEFDQAAILKNAFCFGVMPIVLIVISFLTWKTRRVSAEALSD